jgi:hypothetical protein
VNANAPDEKEPISDLDLVTQEKIREFCYELALALRRITGRVIEGDLEGLPVDMGEKQHASSDTKIN